MIGSQRTVIVEVGQVALVQNIYGVWAAIKLITVENELTENSVQLPQELRDYYEHDNINIKVKDGQERLVFDYEISESSNFLK